MPAIEVMEMELTVIRADGLVAKDGGLFGFKGTSDPYIEVRLCPRGNVNGFGKKYFLGKTQVQMTTLSPRWNEKFETSLPLQQLTEFAAFELTVKDFDASKKHEPMGVAMVKIPTKVHEFNVTKWCHIPKSKEASGRVEVKLVTKRRELQPGEQPKAFEALEEQAESAEQSTSSFFSTLFGGPKKAAAAETTAAGTTTVKPAPKPILKKTEPVTTKVAQNKPEHSVETATTNSPTEPPNEDGNDEADSSEATQNEELVSSLEKKTSQTDDQGNGSISSPISVESIQDSTENARLDAASHLDTEDSNESPAAQHASGVEQSNGPVNGSTSNPVQFMEEDESDDDDEEPSVMPMNYRVSRVDRRSLAMVQGEGSMRGRRNFSVVQGEGSVRGNQRTNTTGGIRSSSVGRVGDNGSRRLNRSLSMKRGLRSSTSARNLLAETESVEGSRRLNRSLSMRRGLRSSASARNLLSEAESGEGSRRLNRSLSTRRGLRPSLSARNLLSEAESGVGFPSEDSKRQARTRNLKARAAGNPEASNQSQESGLRRSSTAPVRTKSAGVKKAPGGKKKRPSRLNSSPNLGGDERKADLVSKRLKKIEDETELSKSSSHTKGALAEESVVKRSSSKTKRKLKGDAKDGEATTKGSLHDLDSALEAAVVTRSSSKGRKRHNPDKEGQTKRSSSSSKSPVPQKRPTSKNRNVLQDQKGTEKRSSSKSRKKIDEGKELPRKLDQQQLSADEIRQQRLKFCGIYQKWNELKHTQTTLDQERHKMMPFAGQ